MRERLSGRELQAATLCYLHQRSRPEAAEIMGLSPRRMEKIMDRVSKRFGALVRDVQGDWCATQDSLIKAYALGILAPDGERHQLAVDHLADCPSCRRRVLGLRGLAAVAPPLPLLLGGAGLAGEARRSGPIGPGTAARREVWAARWARAPPRRQRRRPWAPPPERGQGPRVARRPAASRGPEVPGAYSAGSVADRRGRTSWPQQP